MKATLIYLLGMACSAWSLFSLAAGGGSLPLNDDPYLNISDKSSLQNGASIYMNYCIGCHSLGLQSYRRTAADLEVPETLFKTTFLHSGQSMTAKMDSSMDQTLAETWFGKAPPDLSLTARSRGTQWIYNYLRGYYVDEDSPHGANNVVYENTAMPNVLHQMEGLKRAVFRTSPGKGETFERFETLTLGQIDKEAFDRNARDLTNFLLYVAEPVRERRYFMGIFVIGFLCLLAAVLYALKSEYWRDIKNTSTH